MGLASGINPRVRCAALLIIAVQANAVAAQEHALVTLQGTLTTGQFLGPPGYGEEPRSDVEQVVWYLQLPTTVAAQTDAAARLPETVRLSYFVQIEVPAATIKRFSVLKNKKVKITGQLTEPVLAHHRLTPFAGTRDHPSF